MAFRSITAVALVGLLALSGCNAPDESPDSVQRNWLSIPALPIIQESVFSLKPNVDKQIESELMMRVCGLARGELSQNQVNAFLLQQHVQPDKLPKQGNQLSLLVNGDTSAQSIACAAYLATSVLSPVDAKTFTVWRQGESTRPYPKAAHAETNDKTTAQQPGKSELLIDQASLAVTLPIKLAIARANADVFALIASELQRRPGLSVAEYSQQGAQLFAKLAPVYIKRVRLELPSPGTRYRLLRADAEQFAFTSSAGTLFEFGGEGLTLRQNGVIWYGRGKLLGQDYPLQVAYFDSSVDALLAPDKR